MGFGFEDGDFFIRYKQLEIKDANAAKCLDRFYKLLYRTKDLDLSTIDKFVELHQLLFQFSTYFISESEVK